MEAVVAAYIAGVAVALMAIATSPPSKKVTVSDLILILMLSLFSWLIVGVMLGMIYTNTEKEVKGDKDGKER
jgi:hypothetical protein